MSKFVSNEDFATIEEVDEAHTDVVAIEPVEGGWQIFTDARDYEVWQGQK